GISIQCPEASASPLRSIPAEVSYKAEAISPLMNVLQSRVLLTEEQLTEVHQRLEFP
ncbi:hypothetical protein Tco_1307102, partial [Tanacetum coccineum]